MELEFKRFSQDKQEQIKQFVAYAQMMGLTGKDLVSIGGKLDRLKAAAECQRNKEIVKSFECLPIGSDSNDRHSLNNRFKLKTANGHYKFEAYYGGFQITSYATKAKYNYDPLHHELGRNRDWNTYRRHCVLLDIASGQLSLNF